MITGSFLRWRHLGRSFFRRMKHELVELSRVSALTVRCATDMSFWRPSWGRDNSWWFQDLFSILLGMTIPINFFDGLIVDTKDIIWRTVSLRFLGTSRHKLKDTLHPPHLCSDGSSNRINSGHPPAGPWLCCGFLEGPRCWGNNKFGTCPDVF
jgi:hypothetical protein